MGVLLAVLALLEDSLCLSYWRMTFDSFSWRVSRSSNSYEYIKQRKALRGGILRLIQYYLGDFQCELFHPELQSTC